jgi:hypothetical protein
MTHEKRAYPMRIAPSSKKTGPVKGLKNQGIVQVGHEKEQDESPEA